jgi:ribonuclease HI
MSVHRNKALDIPMNTSAEISSLARAINLGEKPELKTTKTTQQFALLSTVPDGAAVEIFTDGACLNNPGPAAAAFAIVYRGAVLHSSARFLGPGTNNVAELTAAIDGLRFLAERCDLSITLLSDSEQVVKAMPQWVPKWKAKGWRKTDGKPVLNRSLYEGLDAIASRFPSLTWQHIKGHAGHEFNELVDKLATGTAAAGSAAVA